MTDTLLEDISKDINVYLDFQHELMDSDNTKHSCPPPPIIKGGLRPSENWATWGGIQNFLLERGDKPEKWGLM